MGIFNNVDIGYQAAHAKIHVLRIALTAVSATLLFLASAAANLAHAQVAADAQGGGTEAAADAQGAGTTLQEVTVTGSRLVSNALLSPTPLTVVSADQLEATTPGNIADAINKLPQFANSIVPQAEGVATAGGNANVLNLRSLGAQRTLVLLDGDRLVPSTNTGEADINLIPQLLIQRVDIVTGGASASYGSDAVAGVVNFVLDTKFSGVKGEIEGGDSQRNDAGSGKAALAAGTDFAGGQGHVIFSVEAENTGQEHLDNRSWATEGCAPITNPGVTTATPASPTNPSRLMECGVESSAATYGGLITSGPLKGIQFGADGEPEPFNYGTLTSSLSQVGGSGINDYLATSMPSSERQNLFVHANYDVSDNFTAFFQALYGHDASVFQTLNDFQDSSTAFTIFSGNPYIPPSIQSYMTANNVASFPLGEVDANFGPTFVQPTNSIYDVTAGFNGKFGGSWFYEGSYEHGSNTFTNSTSPDTIQQNLYNAADAVINPANGSIVCRSTLTNPTNGCVPIDLLGVGTASAAAIDYVTGSSDEHMITTQDFGSVDIKGAPFSLWAGQVSVAFGGEYRRESAVERVDPISAEYISADGILGYPSSLNNKLGGFQISNPQALSGAFDVKEGFLEVEVPLARDQFWARSLDFNGAARYEDYSTPAGGQTTWKLGLVYQPFQDFRLRATRSVDIRAGDIDEIFASAGQSTMSIIDPAQNDANVAIRAISEGNPNLKPEKATTSTGGITYQPDWLPGFAATVDYYNIVVANAISALSAQTIVTECYLGATQLCPLVERVAGSIVQVTTPTLNESLLRDNGMDIDLAYGVPASSFVSAWRGNVSMRLIGAYVDRLETDTLGAPKVNQAGAFTATGSAIGAEPHWRATLDVDYSYQAFSVDALERYVGSGAYDNTLTTTAININHVSDAFYTDLTAAYKLGKNQSDEVFFTINNLLDRPPPIVPGFMSVATEESALSFYDLVGRAYSVGIRFKL